MLDQISTVGDIPWHVLQTVHQHEKTAAQILTNKGYDVLLPLYRSVHQWRDRKKVLDLPLFSCYVFIRGGTDRQLPIQMTPGVLRFVSSAGRPASIPENEMEAILRLASGGVLAEPHPFLKSGDRVRVKSGPLEGVEGILVQQKDSFRLIVSVQLLKQSASVEVDASQVERVSMAA
jgi:transcription antitermination factor NusG